MRFLPIDVARGALLTQLIRDANRDPRRRRPCAYCGGNMQIIPDMAEQTVRCPACARWQRICQGEETPWRLTAASAEALRRTRSWIRRL